MNAEKPLVLYGSPMSLYTARVRSYFIKRGIAYSERPPHASKYFHEKILPKAGGRRSMPTIEFNDGTVIRDGVAILDYFEQLNDYEYSPRPPKQKIVSLLLDVIGAEGLLRPAMHYRWNYYDNEHFEFNRFHFEALFKGDDKAADLANERIDLLFENALPGFGIVPETHGLIERMHRSLLEKLNRHFSLFPYLLGSKPSIGDFGLMAPFGHLGRDPKPLSLMLEQALRVFRWVERMHRPEADMGEFLHENEEFIEGDEIPETLVDILRHFAIDFVPETEAACKAINEWLAENSGLAAGTEAQRAVGQPGSFVIQGIELRTVAQPFRFYLLERVIRTYEGLGDREQEEVLAMLKLCNMDKLLNYRISRPIGRKDNLEVWL